MKQFIAILTLLVAATTFTVAQDADSVKTGKADTIAYTDTPDTHSVKTEKKFGPVSVEVVKDKDDDFDMSNFGAFTVAIVSIVFVFGLPLFIVFVVSYFNYRTKKRKYALIEKAIENGQPIPEEMLMEARAYNQDKGLLQKGIKKIFLSIGLGVMFWFLTEDVRIVAVAFLIVCMGIGQVVIYYITERQGHK